jgi:hypothetical protein
VARLHGVAVVMLIQAALMAWLGYRSVLAAAQGQEAGVPAGREPA